MVRKRTKYKWTEREQHFRKLEIMASIAKSFLFQTTNIDFGKPAQTGGMETLIKVEGGAPSGKNVL
jgi:hypothetical protein